MEGKLLVFQPHHNILKFSSFLQSAGIQCKITGVGNLSFFHFSFLSQSMRLRLKDKILFSKVRIEICVQQGKKMFPVQLYFAFWGWTAFWLPKCDPNKKTGGFCFWHQMKCFSPLLVREHVRELSWNYKELFSNAGFPRENNILILIQTKTTGWRELRKIRGLKTKFAPKYFNP